MDVKTEDLSEENVTLKVDIEIDVSVLAQPSNMQALVLDTEVFPTEPKPDTTLSNDATGISNTTLNYCESASSLWDDSALNCTQTTEEVIV